MPVFAAFVLGGAYVTGKFMEMLGDISIADAAMKMCRTKGDKKKGE